MSDSVTSDSHPAHRAGTGLARVGRTKISAEDHCMDQMDSFSVSSAGGYGGVEAAGQRVYLTPAQVALQEQLKSKHSELSRRIALQQAELIRLGEQLALTYQQPDIFFNNQQQQQQQQQEQ